MIAAFCRRFLQVVSLVAILLIALPGSAQADQPSEIVGRLVNGTEGAAVPAGVEVVLHMVDDSGNTETRRSVASSSGRFEFKDLPPGEGWVYFLTSEYKGVSYGLQIDDVSPQAEHELVVYETTNSGDDIRIDSNVFIVGWAQAAERSLGVLERVELTNTGDHTFLPDFSQPGPTSFLRFSLPPQYLNLDVQSTLPQGEVVPVERGFALTTPVPPGEQEVLFTYRLLYEGSRAEFGRSFPFGAGRFLMLVREGLGKVKGSGLREVGPAEIGGTRYTILEGVRIKPGATVELQLYDLPHPSPWQRVRDALGVGNLLLIAIPALFGLVLLAFIVYVIRHRRSKEALATSPVIPVGSPEGHTRSSLIEAIAGLDEQFERNEIKEEEYKRLREALMAQLLQTREGE